MFGATGRVGRDILSFALRDGHQVTALVRSPEKLQIAYPNLRVLQGDALIREHVEQTITGQDVVISALSTGGASNLTESAPLIIDAMNNCSVLRIVTVGTAGILNSRTTPGKLRYQAPDSNRKLTRAAEDHHGMFNQLLQCTLHWTIVCPTYLPEGEQLGVYRIERDYLPEDGKMISVSDTAEFTYSQITDLRFIGCRVGIAY
jgi:putative NADH-flavin reductase